MRTELFERQRAAVLGALVADAASLGFHWLYDQGRIRELAPVEPSFRQPDSGDYAGVSGYFAHEKKGVGDLSQYGEQSIVMLDSLHSHGGSFSQAVYQDQFQKFFGYGGGYEGYIDHATRETLNRMESSEEAMGESPEGIYFGANDEQLPAISKLPPLVSRYVGDPELKDVIESAVRVTNHNARAVAYGWVCARALESAILTASPELARDAARQAAPREIASELDAAFVDERVSSAEFTKKLGLSCELKFGVPSVLHQLRRVDSFAASVRDNIWIGGDSCGRAMLLGGVLGACFGVGGDRGIPESWLDRLPRRDMIEERLEAVLGAPKPQRELVLE